MRHKIRIMLATVWFVYCVIVFLVRLVQKINHANCIFSYKNNTILLVQYRNHRTYLIDYKNNIILCWYFAITDVCDIQLIKGKQM